MPSKARLRVERELLIGMTGPGVEASRFPVVDLFGIFKPIEAAVRAIIAEHAPDYDAGFNWLLSAWGGNRREVRMTLLPPVRPQSEGPAAGPDPLQRLVDGVCAEPPGLPPAAIAALGEVAAAIPTDDDLVRMRYDWTIASFGRRLARTPDGTPQSELHGWLWGVDCERRTARLQVPKKRNGQAPFAAILEFDGVLSEVAERLDQSSVCAPVFECGEPLGTLPRFHVRELEPHPCRHIPPDAKLFRWPTEDEALADDNLDEFLEATYAARRGEG